MSQSRNVKFKLKGIFMSITLILFITYTVIAGIAMLFSDRIIFPYTGSSYGMSLSGLVVQPAEDGTPVASRYWEAPSPSHLVVLFHGNYEDLGQLDHIAMQIMSVGYSVLSMDYRGYGLSGGRPSEKRCYSDARLMIRRAQSLGFDESRIILWGRSVGSGPATQLALEINARALVLESPFVTAFRTITRIPLLPFDKFNNLAKMDKVRCPLFILHGTNDMIIPSWHSSKLFDRHRHEKILHLVDGAGHNDLWTKDRRPALLKLTGLMERYDASPSRLPDTR
jgi:fermentation-respiration switch protein FrsA (DUF1100 family)